MNQRLVFCLLTSLAVAISAMARAAAAQTADAGVEPAPLPSPSSDAGPPPDAAAPTLPPAEPPSVSAPPPVTFAPAPAAPPALAPPAVVPPPPLAPVPRRLAPAPPAVPVPPAPPVIPPTPTPASTVIVPPIPETPPPPPEQPPFEREREPVFRPVILLGIISFPRPIEIEALVKVRRTLALGAQYSMLPTLSLPDNSASLKLDAAQGTFRWFPFSGVFYLGGGFGFQRLRASISQPVDGGNLSVVADMSTFFVSPQLGWLWITRSGFAIGINLGVQIPFPREPNVDVTYNGQPLPSQGAPPGVASSANNDKKNVEDIARIIMRYPIPNIDLLKIGLAF